MQQEAAPENRAAIQTTSMVIVGPPSGGLTALQAEDGLVIWDYPTPPARFSIASSNEAIYFSAYSSFRKNHRPAEIIALRIRDGTLLWRTAPKTLQGPLALAADSNRVFVLGHENKQTLFAFDAQTGGVCWMTPDRRGCGYRLLAGWDAVIDWAALSVYFSLPLPEGPHRLLAAQQGAVYVDANHSGVRALDARTGRERWRAGKGWPVSVTIDDTRVYALLNSLREPIITQLRAADGARLDTLTIQQAQEDFLALGNQGIVYLARGQQVCAVRLSDGEPIWSAAHIWGKAKSFKDVALQACLSDQTLAYRIVQLSQHRLTVGALDRQTGKNLWEWHSDEQLASSSNACSIISGCGQLYVATRQGLFAFRERDGTLLWRIWPNTDLSLARLVIAPTA